MWAGRDSCGRNAAQVSWVALGNLSAPELLAVGQFVFSSDARLTVARDPAARSWSLVIESAVKKDSGWYECQVNTVPHTSHRLHLAVIGGAAALPCGVRRAPPLNCFAEPRCEIAGEQSVYLNVGSSHRINCTVSSPQPPAHIFWYFNHQVSTAWPGCRCYPARSRSHGTSTGGWKPRWRGTPAGLRSVSSDLIL